MWKKLKNKQKPSKSTETPNPEKIFYDETENDATPENALPDAPTPLDTEEVSREGIEELISLLEAQTADADYEQPLAMLLDFINSLRRGTVDKELLLTLRKGCSYEADILKARAEGEIAGRNAAIIEDFAATDAKEKSDGVPNLYGAFDSPYSSSNSIFDIARSARI